MPKDFVELDSDFEKEDVPRKRARLEVEDDANEAQLEMETAQAIGLDALAVTEEEEEFLPAGTDHQTYLKVRNHVVARWRSNVSRWLTEAEAGERIQSRFRPLATLAWHFLTKCGYINFGVAPAIRHPPQPGGGPRLEPGRGRDRCSVIVLGAGLAGLSAAQQLLRMGHKVLVLEGRGRPGGRVHTRRLEGGGCAGVADLGGSIITGIDGNPLAVLARQLGIPMHHIGDQAPLYSASGAPVDTELDANVYAQFNDLLDACGRYRDDLGPEVSDKISLGTGLETLWEDADKFDAGPGSDAGAHRRLVDWHMANLEFANAAGLGTLSLKHWDQDDPWELLGPHCFLPGGNLRLVAALAEGLPVMYNNVATQVAYSGQGVAVTTAQGAVFKAEALLVTVPLGVLKAGSIAFSPPLPARKQGAIKRLGFGVLNKAVLLFPHAFWNDRQDMFGHVVEDPGDRGQYYLFYSYAHISGGAVLAALVAGDAALRFERQPAAASVADVMAVVRRVFGRQGVEVPAPLAACCTRWGSDPMARGSYSSVAVGSLGADDYDILAESLGGRVFFAGEATEKRYPATMHGAFISGLREAANINATVAKRGRDERRAAAGAAPLPSTHHPRVPGAPSKFGLQAAQQLARTAVLLRRLFAKCDPDLEFGCFNVLYGPKPLPGSDDGHAQQQALVRFDLSNTSLVRGGASLAKYKKMVVYAVLTRPQVGVLMDVKGGDEARLVVLTREFMVQLVGRAGLSAVAAALAGAIARQRGLSLEGDVDKIVAKVLPHRNAFQQQPQPAAVAPQGGQEQGGAGPAGPPRLLTLPSSGPQAAPMVTPQLLQMLLMQQSAIEGPSTATLLQQQSASKGSSTAALHHHQQQAAAAAPPLQRSSAPGAASPPGQPRYMPIFPGSRHAGGL